jgi:hypothetical protein
MILGDYLVLEQEAISCASGNSEVLRSNREQGEFYRRLEFKILDFETEGATQPLRFAKKAAAARRFFASAT